MASNTPAAGTLGPLHGIKVLDFGHMVMGPSCGLALADLGAEVMRIEPPQGDPTRQLKGFGIGFFPVYNRNKGSAQLNLKQGEDGQEVLRRALEWADVVIENFAPGVMAKLGADWERARQINPRVVYCSLKGYLPGPYQDRLALDEVAQMMGGIGYMTGPVGTPLRAGGSILDITGGLFGVIGILAALQERMRTGQGKLVESALFESAAFYTGQHMAYFSITGEIPRPMPSRSHLFTVYDLFHTLDNDVFIGATSEQQWERLCEEFDLQHLRADPAMATQTERLLVRPQIIEALAKRLVLLGSDEIVERCARAKLPAAKVNRPDQLIDDPHLHASGQMLDIDLPDGRSAHLPGLPLRLDGQPLGVRMQPQPAGRQTRAFLQQLGYGDTDIERLVEAQVIPTSV